MKIALYEALSTNTPAPSRWPRSLPAAITTTRASTARRARALAVMLTSPIIVRQLPVVVTLEAASIPMIIMDAIGTSTSPPSMQGDTPCVVQKLPRTIIGILASLAGRDIEAAASVDEEGFDVRLPLREETSSTNMTAASNNRSSRRIVRRDTRGAKREISSTSNLSALIIY